ncbi:HAD-IA family hydrolase [Actinocrinis puniceicyclus]|uniref:HAD-IA family hydrolase n=2 Tax=Actinocrinis puniceicyclus TaxID=977794 RepID=A0A8J7WQW3_9ACTN|nr:HAD-IA family hydrolase [Actinocrinis puniceicyclus]
MRPIGGRWHPRADFERTVLAWAAPAPGPRLTPRDFARAISAGDRFFEQSAGTPDLDDYHRVLLAELGVDAPDALLAELTRPVEPAAVLEIFPDVLPTLLELRRRGVRMAVVSDAWPDLPDLHAGLGIRDFFEAYAISAVLGCRKPDPRMYHHASSALGLAPADCLFVDDDPALVEAAIELGYAGRVIRRDADHGEPGAVPSIATLAQLPSLL